VPVAIAAPPASPASTPFAASQAPSSPGPAPELASPALSPPFRTREIPEAPDRAPATALAPAGGVEAFHGTVGAETRLLRRADEALRSGQPAMALDLLDEHARTFPQGVLAEERSAERVTTLCALGRTGEARAEAERFLTTTPDSPLASQVRASCGVEDRMDSNRVP
jgi:hypothetical protein